MPPKPKPIIDPMASHTRSKVSIPDAPVTALPSKTIKTKKKPASATATSDLVLVETISSGNAPGETVPAPWGVSVDITGRTTKDTTGNEDDDKDDSAPKKPASILTSRTRTDSVDNTDDNTNDPDDKQSSNNDSANNNDKKNNKKKNDMSSTDTPPDFSTVFGRLSLLRTLHVLS